MQCSCGSGKNYQECCEPFIKGEKRPPTAEALMRSRYVAFTTNDIAYLEKTLAPESRSDFDRASTKEWAAKAEWRGLQVQSVKDGGEGDKKGTVEFTATYGLKGKVLEHHEVAEFRKDPDGQWYFVDGDAHTHEEGKGHQHHHVQETFVRESPKVGRNDPCSCGSGKKYKKCCGLAS